MTVNNELKKVGKCFAIALMPITAIMINTASAEETKLTFSGQVGAAMLFGGDVKDAEVVDNSAAGSRLRIRGSSDAFGVKSFMRYEIGFQENQSFNRPEKRSTDSFDVRYAEAGLEGPWGKMSLGKGDGASNGTAEASYQVSGNLYGGGHLTLFTVRGTLLHDNWKKLKWINEKEKPEWRAWEYYDGFSRVSRVTLRHPGFHGSYGVIQFGKW